MSEDFDKEAERKRLREKYEKDREDRESTERMSELLLQGATMTNRHCDTCGSPIFRYQGQEFCPNCQVEAGGTTETDARQDAPTEEAEPAASAPDAGDRSADTTSAGSGRKSPERRPPSPSTGTPSPETGRTSDASSPQVDGSAVEASRVALGETLQRFSRLAAETDDPHRAQEYLDTAERAAETLRALPRRE